MPKFFNLTEKILLLIFIPLWILISTVQIISTNIFLSFEYNKIDFPIDSFGFNKEQRLDYASQNLRYVREGLPITFLERQRNGEQPLYNNRELSHMGDVQNVFQFFATLWVVLTILIGILGALLWIRPGGRNLVPGLIRNSGLITAGMIATIGFIAVIGWDTWFQIFHKLFFAPGSWTFLYTDTLIRLFPQKFWMDAVFTLSGLSIAAGLLIGLGGWFWSRNFLKTKS
jgi:integral membrane protein (TIGR01906 family)